ncbi:MAG: YesL family protein [Lachnospiraceae bacterium]
MKKLSIENPFFEFMGKIGDIMIINLLFLLCSVPVVTIGASVSAMYKVFGEMGEETYISPFKSFKNAFIPSLKKSTPVWLLSLITGLVLVFDLMFVTKAQASIFWHITGMVTGCLMFLWLLVMCWLFPAALFKEGTLKDMVKRSMFLAVRNFPYTFLMVLLDLIPVICFILGDYYAALVAPVYFIIGFGITALINRKIMDKCVV